ncbi:hypothetical protein B0T25DRAFT_559047 [Lasiosphaeria hispida]|uniref:Uncharacterized protein n=1 Tax=Lasiosphaeria hispida TaxID=260671 RepID=A0AAJ0M8D9_9PEZI|nr:hypothetical protein B0T25DRAFT_559047 [Lasiosphaeria hispida]
MYMHSTSLFLRLLGRSCRGARLRLDENAEAEVIGLAGPEQRWRRSHLSGLPALSGNAVSPRPAPLQSSCHPPMTSTALRVAARYGWQAGSAGRSAGRRVTRHPKRQH